MNKTTLFFHYTTLIFIYVVANGLIIAPQSVLTFIIPSIFLIYAVWINIKQNNYYEHTKLVLVYMIYILVLVFFSSNVMYSLKNVLKSITPLLYFGAAMVLVTDYKALNRLFKSMIVLSFLFVVNMIISNIFNLGGGAYSDEETDYLQTGSIYSEGLNAMGYYLVLVPAMIQMYPFKSRLYKRITLVISLVIFISLLLVMKRGALLVVLFGYVIMLLFSEIKQKVRIVQIVVTSAILLILTYPLYEKMLISRYKVREERLQMDSFETEARYTENALIIDDIIFSGNKTWLFFGHDVLNSRGNYGGGAYGDRQIHNDYGQVLNGSGIIGFLLYIFMNISILTYYLKLKKKIVTLGLYAKNEKMLNIVFWSYFLAYFALGASGSIDSLIYNVIRFIMLGAIIGIFQNIPLHKNEALSVGR